MAKINVDVLNQQIINSDLEGIFYQTTFTPTINSLPARKSSKNICNYDIRYDIRKRFLYNKIPDEYEIPRSLYFGICEFVLGENVPNEEKVIVSKYLNDELKQMIFEKYLSTDLKYKNFKKDSHDNRLWYTPKKNGVPLKDYCKAPNYGVIISNEIYLDYEKFVGILKGITNDVNNYELLSIKHLLNDNVFFSSPWCPDNIKMLKDKLNSEQWNEYETKLCDNNDKLIREDLRNSFKVDHSYHVNNLIKKEIFDSIPNEFSLVEKTIYIYSKLCKLLSYDPVYYINSSSQNHMEVSNIENYDLTNHDVVCYEFAYILSDLLREIGVTKIKEKKLNDDKFSNSHANISYLVDDLVIFADSTRSVNEGDLSQLKFINEFNGIRCELYNENCQNIFQKAKEKVKSYLEYEDMSLNKMLPNKDYIDSLNNKEKLVLFNNYLLNCSLTNTDFISYANKLIKVLGLDVDTKIYYDNETSSRLLLNIELNIYEENSVSKMSYFIDSVDKNVYDYPTDIFTYMENLTYKHL